MNDRSQIHRMVCNRMIGSYWTKSRLDDRIQIHGSGQGSHRFRNPAVWSHGLHSPLGSSFWIQSSGSCSCWTYSPETQGKSSGRDWRMWRSSGGSRTSGRDGTPQSGSWWAHSRSPGCRERSPAGRSWESRGQCCRPGCWGRRSHRRSLSSAGGPGGSGRRSFQSSSCRTSSQVMWVTIGRFWVWMSLLGQGRLYILIIGCVILVAHKNKLPSSF